MQNNLLSRFETYLVEEGFKPGDKLPGELELAERFGVSRGTIREIIVHLTLQGVLQRRSKAGTVLAAPKAETIGRELALQLRFLGCGREELKAARLMIESAAVPEVIRCMTPTQADKLNALIDEMSAAENDPEQADRLDLAFHLALLKITGNRLLEVFAHVLSLLFAREHRTHFRSPEAIQRSVKYHRMMLEAIRGREKERLLELIEEHIRPL